MEDARGCDLLPTERPHLHGPAGSHLLYPKEIGQHLKTGHSIWIRDMKNLITVSTSICK